MKIKPFFFFSLLALFAISAHAQNNTFGVYDLMKLRFVGDAVLSPDGKKVAYTTIERESLKEGASSKVELHVHDVKSGESKPYFTNAPQGFSSLGWTPDGETITFLAAFGGSNQVYGIDLDGGSYYPITKAPHSIADYSYHPQSKSIAYIASVGGAEKNPHYQLGFNAEVFEEDLKEKALFLYDLTSGESTKLSEDVAVHTVAWNPQGTKLACMIAPRNLIDDYYMMKRVYLVDPKTKKSEKIIDNPGKMTDLSWSPDGKHIAIVGGVDKNDPVSGSIFVQNVANPQPFSKLRNYVKDMELSATHVRWYDDETLLYAADESSETTLSLHELGDDKREVVLPAGKVIVGGFSNVGRTVAFAGHTPKHPYELYTFDVKKERLAKHSNLNKWLEGYQLAKQEEISYKARDGMTIKGVLMYPLNYDKNKKYPLINYIHGGPESCVHNGWTTYYSMWGQMAAAKGYFVFMPNYRASSGRGVAYSKADYGDLGDEEFNDVLDGIDYLVKNKGVDRDRVGIGGGSYGGYFSAWAATKHSEHFKASCVFVGVSNQVSKRNTTDIPMEDYLVHWGIWTADNIELVYDRSPVKYAKNNQTPTLILHGKEDTRVHPSQSLELYRQLKLHGDAAVRLIWYPGEGHGNRRMPARIDYTIRTLRWFDYYLQEGNDKDEIPASAIEYEIK